MRTYDHDEAIRLLVERTDATLASDQPGYPHYADPADGTWRRTPDGFWTGGFWGSLLALAAVATGEERYAAAAEQVAVGLTGRAESDTAFRGFLFHYGALLPHLLTGSGAAAESALAGARGLASAFNGDAGLIPLGSQAEETGDVGAGAANIDAVPGTVALLCWAAERTGETGLAEIARRHAARHVEYCVRDDGSVAQSAAFDERTGELQRRYTHKGLSDDSTWARAQAWAMLGFAQAAHWSGPEFLDPALRVADRWIEWLPDCRVAPWDFAAGVDAPRDTSASAIAAVALLRLADRSTDRPHYRDHAAATVRRLVMDHLTPVTEDDPRPAGILTAGCFDQRRGEATAHELIWGDHFLLESLLRLRGDVATSIP